MTASKIDNDSFFLSQSSLEPEQVDPIITRLLPRFDNAVKLFIAFHALFVAAVVGEVTLIATFSTALFNSAYISFAIAALFLTLFMFFILRLFLQAKKQESLHNILDEYIEKCKKLLCYRESIDSHRYALAHACERFAAQLRGREFSYYRPSSAFFRWVSPVVELFSSLCHWHDLLSMKELLLAAAVKEHVKLVQDDPTNLEYHAALANAHLLFAGLCADPREHVANGDDRWIPYDLFDKKLTAKFEQEMKLAIEEFKILNDFAPDDPWVHEQLAMAYRDLKRHAEEMHEYEVVLKLRPDDAETLYKLGVLYFKQGQVASGLQVYEKLKRGHYLRAENLLTLYST